jgi:hypothetical protein
MLITIFLNSSFTSYAQSNDGSKRRDIDYLTRTSKAPSGTNKLGPSALVFLIAV